MDINNVYLKSHYTSVGPEVMYSCDDAVAFIFNEIGEGLVERFLLICLDYEYRPINYSILGIGTADKTLIDLGELFRIVLLSGSKRIFIAHNHLGSSILPTKSDLNTTQQIGYICSILNIDLIDSIIITSNRKWSSIRKYIMKNGDKVSGLEQNI